MKTAWLLLLALLVPDPAGAPPVPRGILKLRVLPPWGQSVPREISVRVRPTRQVRGLEDHPWEVTLSSPLHDGEWIGEVPAGRIDLRLQGTALMPVYKWGVSLEAGQTEDLGTLKLERGAAISGWVRTVEEKIPTHSLQVSLEPEKVGNLRTVPDSTPLRTITLESDTRPWGFFRFVGVKPGRYIVRASDPGLPTARSEPIVIEGDRSFELPEPLWVTPKVGIDVQVSPPAGPDRQPWSFMLEPDRRLDEGENWRPLTGTSSKLGRWELQGLPPGDYRLAVGLAADNVWHKEKVRLRFPSTPVRIGLSFLRVRGRLTWREGPLAGALDFDNDRGSASLRADAQGQFQGYLPNDGPWDVAVTSSEALQFRLRLQDRIRVPKTLFTWLEIRIPDTALPVEVTDNRGRSLSRTTVNVLGNIRNQAVTDEFGRIELVGLKPGPQCLLAAADAFRRSEETPLVLREGETAPLLRLVIPAKTGISGRVLPALGFGTGAQVLAWPSGSNTSIPAQLTGTDEDGRFGLSLPLGTTKTSLVVLPPGSALRILDAEVTRDRLLEIHVDTAGGTLILELPEQDLEDDKDRQDSEPCDPASRTRNVLTMPRILRRWADLQGTPQTPGQLVVPNVEPGPYTLCATEKAPVLSRGAPPEGDSRCTGGILEAAGELTLKLPPVPAKSSR